MNDNSNLIIKEKKERLKKILVNKSRFLANLPRPVFIGKRENSTIAIFTFPSLFKRSAFTKTPRIKFVWLAEKRENFLISSGTPDISYREEKIFQEIIKEDNQTVEKTEEILIEKFAQNLDNYYITKEICKEENYNPNCLKTFNKELKSNDPKIFFDNLHKFIYFLVHGRSKDLTEKIHNNRAENSIFCGSEKDILIIAEPETYRFIKQNDTNDFLKNLVGDIICANLENRVKLIIIAKWGILVPCYIKPEISNGYHYLDIHYEINLDSITPALLFKE